MVELHKSGRMQTDNHMKCRSFVVKVKKINLIKFELKYIEQWSFLPIRLYAYAPDYGKLSDEVIFCNVVKNMDNVVYS